MAAQVLDHGQRQAPMVGIDGQCGVERDRIDRRTDAQGMRQGKDAADETGPIVGRRTQRPALEPYPPAQECRIRYRHQVLAAILRDPYPTHEFGDVLKITAIVLQLDALHQITVRLRSTSSLWLAAPHPLC